MYWTTDEYSNRVVSLNTKSGPRGPVLVAKSGPGKPVKVYPEWPCISVCQLGAGKIIITVHDTVMMSTIYEQEIQCHFELLANMEPVFTICTLNHLTAQKFWHSAWAVNSYCLRCLNLVFASPVAVNGEHFKMAPLKAAHELRMALWSKWNLPGVCP